MMALYVISIGIAWLVAPRAGASSPDRNTSRNLKLVFVAAVIDQARRRDRSPAEFPRLSRAPKRRLTRSDRFDGAS